METFGIEERCCSSKQFTSTMKAIYQDFHVCEIDSSGTVLHLDELISRNDVASELEESKSTEQALYESVGTTFQFTDAQVRQIESLASAEDVQILKDFLSTPIDASRPFCSLTSSTLNDNKEARKTFHAYVRSEFGQFLVTDTLESDEGRSIRVWIKKFQQQEQTRYKRENVPSGGEQRLNKKGKPIKNTAGLSVGVMMKDPWPKDRPEYLHFRLYKENRDTAEAIQCIARCLRLPPKSFNFCGTKDRRAVTVQGVSVYRVSIESMRAAVLHSSWDNSLRISHLEYRSYPNRIGGANGNNFRICLKQIDPTISNEEINDSFTQLQQKGFLNYYGNQRFGTRSVRTHHVGGLLLAQNWKGVMDALLSPEADTVKTPATDATATVVGAEEVSAATEEVSGSRNFWRTAFANNDIASAYEQCPSYLYIEKSLLRALHHSGQSTNYLNAISALPSSTCHMYLHAVQSLAFNYAVTERMRLFDHKVVVGDLVAVAAGDNGSSAKKQRTDSGEEVTEEGVEGEETEEGDDGKVTNVKVIESQEEAESYSITDVVLTLVGSEVQIPPVLVEFYTAFFQNTFGCDLSVLTNGKAAGAPAFLRLRGAYRKIVQKANNLKWSIHENVADNDIVIRSDADLLRQSAATEEAPVELRSAAPAGSVPNGVSGTGKAVVFECDLNSGVYLTMAIREVTNTAS